MTILDTRIRLKCLDPAHPRIKAVPRGIPVVALQAYPSSDSMTSPTHPADGFFQNLRDSNLLATSEVDLLAQIIPQHPLAELDAVDSLLRNGKLTRYQIEAVRHRRFETLRIGNYDLLDRLGTGGMGTVYMARHRRMKRVVALKLFPEEMMSDEWFVRRFQREVETIAALNHPNVVMAYDADEHEGRHFLVMELVSGHDLACEVGWNGPLSVAAAVDAIRQAATGLSYAHGRGIVHRDVKPANLLRDATGLVKIADLGLVRLINPNRSRGHTITEMGGVLGTADYIAPEQSLDSTTVDHRADVYSLGHVLYFLLTGQPPYRASSIMGLLLMHRESPTPSLKEARPEVPDDLVTIYERMVEKNPSNRYPTMGIVVAALDTVAPRTTTMTDRPPAVVPSGEQRTVASDQTVVCDSDAAETGAQTVTRLQLSVVVVEPSRTQGGIVKRYLSQIGVTTVQVLAAGRDAVAAVRAGQVDVVLSSLHLADMTGPELFEALRADPAASGVGFVLASSEADGPAADVRGARVALLPKPYDLGSIVIAMAQATGLPASHFRPRF